jgi:hypothetical protein
MDLSVDTCSCQRVSAPVRYHPGHRDVAVQRTCAQREYSGDLTTDWARPTKPSGRPLAWHSTPARCRNLTAPSGASGRAVVVRGTAW